MIVKFHPGKHSFRNGASNACVYTNHIGKQCLCTHKHEKTPEPLLRIGCIFLLVEAPAPNPGEQNVLGNDSFRIGYSIKNRFEERVCSQKVYSKNRKSRDKSTVTQLAYFFHNLLLTPNARIAIMPARKHVF